MAETRGARPNLGSLWIEQLRTWNACGHLFREQSERLLDLWGRQAFELQRGGQRLVAEQLRFAGRLGSGLCRAWGPSAAGSARAEPRRDREPPRPGAESALPKREMAPPTGGMEAADAGLTQVPPGLLPRETASSAGEADLGPQWQGLQECPPGTEPEPGAPVLGPDGAEVAPAKRRCRPKQPKRQGKGSPATQ